MKRPAGGSAFAVFLLTQPLRFGTATDKSLPARRVAGKVLNVQKKNLQKQKESGGKLTTAATTSKL